MTEQNRERKENRGNESFAETGYNVGKDLQSSRLEG